MAASFIRRRHLGVLMPKPEWGVKHLCGSCATRFYDLGKEEAECPNCGAPYISALAMAERAKASKATAADEDDDDDLVDDEDELETADDVVDADDDDDDDDSDDVVLDDDSDDDDDDDIGDDVLLDDDDDDDDLGDFASVPDEPKET